MKKKKDTIPVRKFHDRKKDIYPSISTITFNASNPAFVHVKLHSLIPLSWTRRFGNQRNDYRLVAYSFSLFTLFGEGSADGPVVIHCGRGGLGVRLGIRGGELGE